MVDDVVNDVPSGDYQSISKIKSVNRLFSRFFCACSLFEIEVTSSSLATVLEKLRSNLFTGLIEISFLCRNSHLKYIFTDCSSTKWYTGNNNFCDQRPVSSFLSSVSLSAPDLFINCFWKANRVHIYLTFDVN